MPTNRWLVFDTTIYIAAIRGGLESAAARALTAGRARTYLSSVVSAELRAGATAEIARRAVHELTIWSHRVGRVVTPTAASWERAGDVLGRMRRREPALRSKTASLWNDVLIALCARQVGASVVTENLDDFELLRRYVRFDLAQLPSR
ncbi:MAG: type II toxin-antitoxin system VapC family toxin [Candidatus Rokubacteria bacterium]|nr:type II toxin-antitoxin system VapC family toxin [Candidatus Rokubacteria bacterium]